MYMDIILFERNKRTFFPKYFSCMFAPFLIFVNGGRSKKHVFKGETQSKLSGEKILDFFFVVGGNLLSTEILNRLQRI